MGNHYAGERLAREVIAVVATRQNETALELLDQAVDRAKNSSGFTPDVEFESTHPHKEGFVHPFFNDWRDPHPMSSLGMLMVEAFAPNGLRDLSRYWAYFGTDDDGIISDEDEQEAVDAYWKEVITPFSERYGLI